MNNEIYDLALKYHKHGWSLVPITRGQKFPSIAWTKYQTEKATIEEIKEWFDVENPPNIGVVTGKISQLTVVDVEKGGDWSKFPTTLTSKTGGGGVHLFYRYADVNNYVRTLPLTDIRGNNGIIVLPPSIHPSGNKYEWICKEDEQPFPYQMFNLSPAKNTDWEKLLTGGTEGSRNDSAAKVVGKFLTATSAKDWNTVAWDMTILWNLRNKPPLEERELRSTFNSIVATRIRSGKLNDADSRNPVKETERDDCDIKLISEIAKNLTDDLTVSYPTGFAEYDKAFMGGVKEGDLVFVTGYSGQGKCHGKGTKILMFDGTIKNVEDIKDGELLMGDDSKPRRVLSLARGREQIYKIRPFKDKGESFTANESHILSLVGNSNNYGKHFVNISIKDYLKKPKTWKSSFLGYRTGVNFIEKQLPIDPYFIGLWLGDGHSGYSAITTMDSKIVDYIYDFADKNGYTIRVKTLVDNRASEYHIARTKSTPIDKRCKNSYIGKSLTTRMRELLLIKNKHIPLIYKTATRQDRLKLLAGLIDTDGYTNDNCYNIIQRNKKLANDIVYLCRSLGYASYLLKPKVVNGVAYQKISIWGNLEEIPVLLTYKKCTERKQIKNPLHYSFTVEKLGVDDYYGFNLDGNHLYLLGDFTVTHNTLLLQSMAHNFVKSGQPTLFFSFEVTIGELWRKFKEMGVDDNFLAYAPEKNTIRRLDWVHEKIKDARDRFKTKIIFLDHLGFLAEEPKNYDSNLSNNYATVLTMICRRLKTIAIDEGVVIVLAGHLRKPLNGQSNDATMHDIKDSSGVAQESDSVVIVSRKKLDTSSRYQRGSPTVGDLYGKETFVKIEKNRRTGQNKVFEVAYEKGRLVDSTGELGKLVDELNFGAK